MTKEKEVITKADVAEVKAEDLVKDKKTKKTEEKKEETPLEVVQRVLSEYNNLESDIPVNSEYWTAKGKLNYNAD